MCRPGQVRSSAGQTDPYKANEPVPQSTRGSDGHRLVGGGPGDLGYSLRLSERDQPRSSAPPSDGQIGVIGHSEIRHSEIGHG